MSGSVLGMKPALRFCLSLSAPPHHCSHCYSLSFSLLKKKKKEKSSQTQGETPNNPLRKWAKDMNRHFTEEDQQLANKCMKICSMSLVIRKIEINSIGRDYYICISVAKIKKL